MTPFGWPDFLNSPASQVDATIAFLNHREVKRKKSEAAAKGGMYLTNELTG